MSGSNLATEFQTSSTQPIELQLCTDDGAGLMMELQGSHPVGQAETEEEDEKKEEEVDAHTFVALIDILFTDYSKRTCTGTIIHDNVVITTAHCFVVQKKPYLQPELTASFVVIGTKKMFETKYEQYLPIERVIIHPKYTGWTADLALVFTFSGMTSDKPGTTVPLDGERTSTPVDSNVTVLSWGSCVVNNRNQKKTTKTKVTRMVKYYENADRDDRESDETSHRSLRSRNIAQEASEEPQAYRDGQIRSNRYDLPRVSSYSTRSRTSPTRYQSRYLSSGEADPDGKSYRQQWSSHESNSTESEIDNRMRRSNLGNESANENNNTHESGLVSRRSFKSIYHNWRRSMGSEENKLTVDVFGFVNMQVCKKMVEKAMPAPYEIRDSNDIVCYASEDHYITTEDSGAPAIRLGHLVAVTVGGTECDGDHVAIGMKMSCYCSWIAENLPDGAPKMKCCKNCCDVKHKGPSNS